MTDKVQKIREEVEKRYEYWKEKESNSHSIESEIRMSECQHLLLMLDSLQEEPVSEDLEEAALLHLSKNYDTNVICDEDEKCVVRDFKAGAQWQKQKDSIVRKDLEEASKEWLSPQLDKSYAAYGETKQMEMTHFDGYAMLDAIEFGAKWQKEQMMKGCFIPDAKFIEFKLGESYSFDSKGFDKEKAKAYGAKEGDTIVAYFFVKNVD